jgi:hypothetical protein
MSLESRARTAAMSRSTPPFPVATCRRVAWSTPTDVVVLSWPSERLAASVLPAPNKVTTRNRWADGAVGVPLLNQRSCANDIAAAIGLPCPIDFSATSQASMRRSSFGRPPRPATRPRAAPTFGFCNADRAALMPGWTFAGAVRCNTDNNSTTYRCIRAASSGRPAFAWLLAASKAAPMAARSKGSASAPVLPRACCSSRRACCSRIDGPVVPDASGVSAATTFGDGMTTGAADLPIELG